MDLIIIFDRCKYFASRNFQLTLKDGAPGVSSVFHP